MPIAVADIAMAKAAARLKALAAFKIGRVHWLKKLLGLWHDEFGTLYKIQIDPKDEYSCKATQTYPNGSQSVRERVINLTDDGVIAWGTSSKFVLDEMAFGKDYVRWVQRDADDDAEAAELWWTRFGADWKNSDSAQADERQSNYHYSSQTGTWRSQTHFPQQTQDWDHAQALENSEDWNDTWHAGVEPQCQTLLVALVPCNVRYQAGQDARFAEAVPCCAQDGNVEMIATDQICGDVFDSSVHVSDVFEKMASDDASDGASTQSTTPTIADDVDSPQSQCGAKLVWADVESDSEILAKHSQGKLKSYRKLCVSAAPWRSQKADVCGVLEQQQSVDQIAIEAATTAPSELPCEALMLPVTESEARANGSEWFTLEQACPTDACLAIDNVLTARINKMRLEDDWQLVRYQQVEQHMAAEHAARADAVLSYLLSSGNDKRPEVPAKSFLHAEQLINIDDVDSPSSLRCTKDIDVAERNDNNSLNSRREQLNEDECEAAAPLDSKPQSAVEDIAQADLRSTRSLNKCYEHSSSLRSRTIDSRQHIRMVLIVGMPLIALVWHIKHEIQLAIACYSMPACLS